MDEAALLARRVGHGFEIVQSIFPGWKFSTADTVGAFSLHGANNGDVAGGQLAVFQGVSEAPISESYGSSDLRGKTANWPRPEGLR